MSRTVASARIAPNSKMLKRMPLVKPSTNTITTSIITKSNDKSP